MNDIKAYSTENLDKLKLWLNNMSAQGHAKFFEILADGVRVVHKTDKLREFDQYLQWIDEMTKSMRVLVYNTRNSHRSQIFEFRTENYVEGISGQLYPTRKRRQTEDEIETRVQQAIEERKKELAHEDLQNKATELSARLTQAESYICDLEAQLEAYKAGKNNFDVNSLFNLLSGFATANPQAGESLEGIKTMLQPNQKSEPTNKNRENEVVADDSYIKIPRMALDNDQCNKVYELADFLVKNPHYINTVHGMFKSEASKAE